ncbi:MAG: prolipoprotein diacylglyceryl transferase [Anaerolineae bacterium]|nr:prolipoprotein diacylglyceryl transferase [Anaerolineae bacterium]
MPAPPFLVRILGQEWPAYRLALTLALLSCLVLALSCRAWREPLARKMDALLLSLASGLIAARLGHVLSYWPYFRDNLDEALRLDAGGLDGRLGFVGAFLALAGLLAWRRQSLPALWDRLAWGVLLLALAGWWGCWGNFCAYGQEVANMADYPPWLTWESEDIYGIRAPRFAVQGLALLGLVVWGLILLLSARMSWQTGLRLWWTLAVACALSLGLGFLRGETDALRAFGLRADQWLDLVVGAWSLLVIGYAHVRKPRQP